MTVGASTPNLPLRADEPAAVWVARSSLHAWADNPRKNDGEPVAKVAASIKRFGFASPIIARTNGEVIAGHTRLKAAEVLGLERVPVRYLDLDPAEAHLLALADNKLNEEAEWHAAAVASLLSDYSLDDAALAGWDSDDLEKLANELGALEPKEVTEDEVPEVPVAPVTKAGDLWLLGAHRVLCGDSTKAEDVERLVNGAKVNVAFTSPPYASQRKYDESSGFKPIHPDKFVEWFADVQANVSRVLAADGSWFVNIKEHCDDGQRSLYVKDLTIAHVRAWGWRFVDEFCWSRNSIPISVDGRFKNGWEPIFHFARGRTKFRPDNVSAPSNAVPFTPPSGSVHLDGPGGNVRVSQHTRPGMARPSNVVAANGTGGGACHSAAFPVALPEFFVKAFSDSGDVIYDPFLGSGTTLIAAEQLGRKCYGMEISPQYVDVIVKRWENLTGKTATLEAS